MESGEKKGGFWTWKVNMKNGLNSNVFDMGTPDQVTLILRRMKDISNLSINKYNEIIREVWDDRNGNRNQIPQMHADGTIYYIDYGMGPINRLRILTLNLGYNIMGNKIAGSEAPMVSYCQKTYSSYGGLTLDNKIAQCTENGIELFDKYDIIGLQEVNLYYQQSYDEFLKRIREVGLKNGMEFDIFLNRYFDGSWGLLTIADRNLMGEGISITPARFEIYHSNDPKKDRRGFQLVYFPKLKLLVTNTHVPHNISLKESLEDAFDRALPYFNTHGVNVKNIKTVILLGDFNDHKKAALNASFLINVYGKSVKIPEETTPPTCCTDSKYQYYGDYIMLGSDYKISIGSYGVPLEFNRWKKPISDHDPLGIDISF